MGQLIIFEGLDGSGKGTQTKLTAQRLKEQGRDLRQITFPDYDSESSALVKMYLSGAFGDKPDDVNAYAASSFYAVDRFASYKTDWGEFYREGGLVLSDRYTTSNAVHQCSKLPPMHWDGFLNWLFDFEYKKFGIPAPDAVIYLAVDPEVSQRAGAVLGGGAAAGQILGVLLLDILLALVAVVSLGDEPLGHLGVNR